MTEKRFQGRGGPFTRYVEICNERTPTADEVREVLAALRTSLWEVLRRRGLSQASPTYLGIVGHPTWNRQALDDFAVEAFEYIFIRRKESLQRHLRVKSDLTGLVYKNLGHLLFERQRKHDPIGYRLFDIVRGAVEEGITAGDLKAVGAWDKVSSSTVLIPRRRGPAPPGFSIASEVASWTNDLLTGLIVGRGQRKSEAVAFLRRRLAEMPVEKFALGEVLEPLKSDARQRWSRMLRDSGTLGGESEEVGDWTLPAPEDPHRFERFIDCVTECIGREPGDEAQKSDLLDLWRIYSAWAQGDLPSGWRGSPERPPSQRMLAAMLGIHRDRLQRLIQILQRLVDSCRE